MSKVYGVTPVKEEEFVLSGRPNIAVICPPDEETDHLHLYEKILGDIADIHFLSGAQPQEREEVLAKSDVVVSASCAPSEISPSEIALLKPGGLLQLLYSGADNVPFDLVPENVMIASNAGVFAVPIAEHVLAMVLCLLKRIVPRYEELKKGVFDRKQQNRILRGKTCGILGFGGNGRAIARIMRSAGVKVIAINRSGKTGEPVDEIWDNSRLDDLLRLSDVLVLTTPLTESTRGLIGDRELSLMPSDAILVNVARGAVVDQGALYSHLVSHPGFCAAIDAWWSEPDAHGQFRLEFPFFGLPNFLGSPHVADNVPGTMSLAVTSALENVRGYLEGGKLKGLLDRTDYQ